MEKYLGLIAGAVVIAIILRINSIFKRKKNASPGFTNQSTPAPDNSDISEEGKPLPIAGSYQKKWLFSYNEKDAFNKLKPIAEKLGYTVFAKVRMLDLLEPTKGNPKYKTYFYKVQAKHVDFVLCDEKLVARYVIELDDNSHNTEDRKKRDAFVDEVLRSVGYKVIHTRSITEEIEKVIR